MTSKKTDASESPSEPVSDETEGHLLLEDTASVNSLEKIYEVFSASARRWEAIVYPALIAFIILATYGFYLIFSLTSDVSKVVTEMRSMSSNMVSMSKNMDSMTNSVLSMSQTVKVMETTLTFQLVEMQKFNSSMVEMNKSMRAMSLSMNQMRYDMGMMNRNVSRPMNFMNSFMPW